MSSQEIAKVVGESTSRRGFLRRVSFATLGVVTGALGLSSPAKAHYYHIHGCHLCAQENQGCNPPYCSWCWNACDCTESRLYRCCEGYTYSYGGCLSGSCPDSGGGGWICSYFVDTGQSCSC